MLSPVCSGSSPIGPIRRMALPSLLVFVLLGAPSVSSAQSPSTGLQNVFSTVDSLRSHNNFERALSVLDSLADSSPKHVSIHWRRSLLITDLGKQASDDDTALTYHRRALDAAEIALDIDSTSAWAHFVAALAEGRMTLYVGRSERVRRSRAVKHHADRAVALDSTFAGAYHLRGRWHRQIAELNFLERALVRALYGGLPDASYEQSVRNFQRAIELESMPYNHLELGKTYLRMDRDAAAREQFRTALATSGSPFDAEYKREATSLLNELR